MGAPGGRRRYGIVAASVAAHAVLAALLVLNAPRLRAPVLQSGPPEAIIPILIMPRTPPPSALAGAAPTQVRLHRRTTRFSDPNPPVAPLPAPPEAKPSQGPATAPGPRVINPPSPDDALAVNARNALRSKLSCESAALSRAEREACLGRFADAARDAPFVGLGVNRDKAAGLDAAAARRERDYKYQRGIKLTSPPTPGAGWDTYRGPPSPAAALGGMAGSDNPVKRIPF